MKKHLSKILTTTLILSVGGGLFLPHFADAANIIEGVGISVINYSIAAIANFFLMATSWLLAISGTFLSVSINITTHIKEIFFAPGATGTSIETVWRVVRDLSSIVIIFALIYFSISTILQGENKSGLKTLIINIFIAGFLINFSLFFVKVAVDASNLISLQFYNAIAPETAGNITASAVYQDGGLSDIFMQSLKIPRIYQNAGVLKSVDVAAGISFAAIGGIVMMVTAALSFLAAALAFTIRTGIILFVMALSPLYFAGIVFPKLKAQVSDKIWNLLKGQLVFMPVYLFLMYIALKLISDKNFLAILNPTTNGGLGTGPLGPVAIGVIIQYAIALIFINAPLVVAISLGGMGMKWAPGSSGINAINEWLGKKAKSTGEGAYRNTISRAASRVAADPTVQRFAGSSAIGNQLLRGTRAVAENYNTRLTQRVAEREATYNSLTDRDARTTYAGRMSGSLSTRSGRLSMAATGRADRVGAARILTRRQSEITAEINQMLARRRQLEAIINGNPGNNVPPRPLTAVEQQEYNDIGDPNNAPGPALQSANNNLATINAQITAFQANNGGASPGQVNRRGY